MAWRQYRYPVNQWSQHPGRGPVDQLVPGRIRKIFATRTSVTEAKLDVVVRAYTLDYLLEATFYVHFPSSGNTSSGKKLGTTAVNKLCLPRAFSSARVPEKVLGIWLDRPMLARSTQSATNLGRWNITPSPFLLINFLMKLTSENNVTTIHIYIVSKSENSLLEALTNFGFQYCHTNTC